MAVVEDDLHDNCIIEASVEHPADRIRNTTGEKTGSQVGKEKGVVISKQSRLTSNIATSAVPNIDERMNSDAWA
jgi:hypothetical protein